jgi:uncharacterized membrane protein
MAELDAHQSITEQRETSMNPQREKIRRFSRILHILFKIAFVLLIIIASLGAVGMIWALLGFQNNIWTIAGLHFSAPLLFKLGGAEVYLPIGLDSGPDFQTWDPTGSVGGALAASGLNTWIGIVLITIGVGFALPLLKRLASDGSPFQHEVVRTLRNLAIALVVIGFMAGPVARLGAGIVGVMYFIFKYGALLQQESDTTL